MGLKINGNIIHTIKINGKEISLGKINGSIIFDNKNNETLTISIDGKNIIVKDAKKGNYDLYYANDSGIIEDYEKIVSLNFNGSDWTYSYFNELNVAPSNATKIVLLSNNQILSSVDLTNDFKFNTEAYGNKLYSVGLLSDIHIDGNGDGNNSDSGNSQSDFANALQYFNTKNVDFICICGDITYYGYDADYEAYKTLVNTYSNNIPIKAIRGNHECYVNGSSNYDYTNTKFQENVNDLYYEYIYNNDVYLFCGMYKESSSTPFSDEELVWLSTKLEEYKNKRIFLFVHYYYGDVGNLNHIVSIHKPISNQTFINLITKYKNITYFSGHTHLAFNTQKYGKYNNIKSSGDICNRVHIPSCSYPRKSPDGTEGSYKNYPASSEGCLMEVYENGILLKGINFETNKFLPIASYYLNTPIEISGEEVSSSTMATEWLDYGNPHFEGSSRAYNGLDTWIYNTSENAINGVYLDLVTAKPCEFKMTADYHSYKGAPTKYCVFILDSNNNDAIVNRYDYEFNSNGTLTTRELTVNLHRDGKYKVVIGSDKGFEFGVKITQISLTELLSN